MPSWNYTTVKSRLVTTKIKTIKKTARNTEPDFFMNLYFRDSHQPLWFYFKIPEGFDVYKKQCQLLDSTPAGVEYYLESIQFL